VVKNPPKFVKRCFQGHNQGRSGGGREGEERGVDHPV